MRKRKHCEIGTLQITYTIEYLNLKSICWRRHLAIADKLDLQFARIVGTEMSEVLSRQNRQFSPRLEEGTLCGTVHSATGWLQRPSITDQACNNR